MEAIPFKGTHDALIRFFSSVFSFRHKSDTNPCFRRGTLGGAEHRNTAENIDKYRNTAKKNRQISQYRIESR